MENNYSSRYSGEQIDAAVEYFLRHSQTEEGSYEYTSTIFCEATTAPSLPFSRVSLPIVMPASFPFAGVDGNHWYDIPNTPSTDWYQCTLRINSASGKVVSLGSVIKLTTGNNGNDGAPGQDGQDGTYVEFRYKRSNLYAIILTSELKSSRNPAGWTTDWNSADVQDYAQLKDSINTKFDAYLYLFSDDSITLSPAPTYPYFTGTSWETFLQLSDAFASIHPGRYLIAVNDELEAIIMNCFNEFKALYDRCNAPSSTETPVACDTEYHKIWTTYIDPDHFWVLFLISAKISGDGETLITDWSNPLRLLGIDGKPGPKGSNGIDGIPGVNIGIAFTLGTELGVRSDAVNPTKSPYSTNYSALFQAETKWTKEPPTVTTIYPYIWFTQCRYIVHEDTEGNKTYEFEDTWSTPQRYTGLNGVTTHEVVYTRNPIIYPAGVFALHTTYSNDGYRTPYVYYNGNYYYLSGQGTFTSYSGTNNPQTASSWWTLMEHFKALFAEVAIIANGLVGSAVFNGDYMFSQQGTDNWGNDSSHYERFLINAATGQILKDPYDTNAWFKPNFCINFKTGEFWSKSVDDKITKSESSIIQTASSIALNVKQELSDSMQEAGINITSGKVKVTGEFEGTSSGTFNGDVSAKSFTVIDNSGNPTLRFIPYNSSLGNPSNGNTPPEEGTPVIVINFEGKQYLVNTIELTFGGSGKLYVLTPPSSDTKRVIVGTPDKSGNNILGNTYTTIGKAPFLTEYENSQPTGVTIPATLHVYNGDTLKEENASWSDYIGRLYTQFPLEKVSTEQEQNNGILVYKLLLNKLRTLSGTLYDGISNGRIMALGVGHGYYTTARCAMFQRITVVSGKVTPQDSYVIVGKEYYIYNNIITAGTNYVYYNREPYSQTLYSITEGKEVTSPYFAIEHTNSSTLWTFKEISNNKAIIMS